VVWYYCSFAYRIFIYTTTTISIVIQHIIILVLSLLALCAHHHHDKHRELHSGLRLRRHHGPCRPADGHHEDAGPGPTGGGRSSGPPRNPVPRAHREGSLRRIRRARFLPRRHGPLPRGGAHAIGTVRRLQFRRTGIGTEARADRSARLLAWVREPARRGGRVGGRDRTRPRRGPVRDGQGETAGRVGVARGRRLPGIRHDVASQFVPLLELRHIHGRVQAAGGGGGGTT
jgi:hypothetical protein